MSARKIGLAVALTLVAQLLAPSDGYAQRLSEEEMRAQFEKLGSDDPQARLDAVEVLGRRGWRLRREIAPRLQRLLRDDPDWRVRASSGRAIGRLSTRSAVPDLVRALRDPQVEVRVVAAAALWRLPDPAAVPALVELLNDRDAAARQWGALALGVIHDPRATQALLRIIDDPESSVRIDVIRSLGRIGDARAMTALQDVAKNADKSDEERLEAVNAIASIESPDKVNALTRLLSLDDDRVRLRVIQALGQVGDALAIPALRRQRSSERGDNRAAVDTAIREIQQRARERREQGND
ncbi:MAG: HEAT repeat domain-containing protein [Deltaproteobacteria bacterium]|nr:HEAT repeat domain-containing protein [Deltaproteobacteria bacterium]